MLLIIRDHPTGVFNTKLFMLIQIFYGQYLNIPLIFFYLSFFGFTFCY